MACGPIVNIAIGPQGDLIPLELDKTVWWKVVKGFSCPLPLSTKLNAWKQNFSFAFLTLFLLFFPGWRYFDDRNVTETSEERVVSKYAYVLFYKRRHTASNQWLQTDFEPGATPKEPKEVEERLKASLEDVDEDELDWKEILINVHV